MTGYIAGMLDKFPVKFSDDKRVPSPAMNDMFSECCGKYLEEKMRELFHNEVPEGPGSDLVIQKNRKRMGEQHCFKY